MALKSRIKSFFSPIAMVLLAVTCGAAVSEGDGGRGEPFALILIDTDALACSPCLEPLQVLCRAVPPDIQKKRLLGVLTYRDDGKPDPRRARIARTRWAGYSRASGILFPTSVDEIHAFNRLSEAGTTILLFDDSAGRIRRWSAPFQPDALRELAESLSTRKPEGRTDRP